MRLGLVPENPIEWLILKLNVVPAPLLETQFTMTMARTIMAAVRLDIFEALKAGPATAAEVARTCGTHPAATEKLLGALVGCSYLKWKNGKYALNRVSRKWMLKDSPRSLRDKLIFQLDEWEMIEYYEDFVRSGKPLELHSTLDDAQYWDRYQRGMRSLAGLTAAEVAARLPVPDGAERLLDIGGSHGFYSVSLCRKYPALRATILDLPSAVEQAAPILAAENMGDRVAHRAGNALTDDLGDGEWDVVFVSQLVHHFTDSQNRELVKRIARALRPGGVLVILDSILPETPTQAGQISALLDLYFAALSESGTWPLETMQSWQRDAGLHIESPIGSRVLASAALVVATKPA